MNLEKSINVVASFGAAVVIVGALFKIVHWSGANEMLMVGMFTEAAIFILFGVLYLQQKPEKDYQWENVYPELVGGTPNTTRSTVSSLGTAQGLSPEAVENLNKSIKGLTDTANSLQEITKVTGATKDFVSNLNSSSESLSALNKSVADAANSIGAISTSSQEASKFTQQYAKAGEQLSSLNSIYEAQIQEGNKHLQALNSYYAGINSVAGSVVASEKDAELFKAELAKLNANIQSLNQVYGSMLTAMKG